MESRGTFPSDFSLLKKIEEAERRCETILHEAETAAAKILEKARLKAEQIGEARKKGESDRFRLRLEKALLDFEQEEFEMRERSRAEADRLLQERRKTLPDFVDRLMKDLLPS